jgi:cellulose synthase/poly-beta-1,6-N-acetylglucosamine synthase-like glycosyltransferase
MKEIGFHLLSAIYFAVSLGLLVYGLHCYAMVVLFVRRQKRCRLEIENEVQAFNQGRAPAAYPYVTIQIPVYNEGEVAARLIRSAAELDYPRDRYEVQVVDDSTDETRQIVDQAVRALAHEGVNAGVARRSDRKDFKAGALAAATPQAQGEFLAIFDADFVIPAHFLKRTMALFHNHPDVACVQSRWGHTNRTENWLTRTQSVGIDAHFAAEQGARSYSGLCMNFNGTAGVWRKAALLAVGGWQGDTLTEDLDLSYRVQLAGHRIRFDFDLECPAELPNNVVALKSQQRRWAKGSMETALKLMPTIFRSPRLSARQKIEAFLHLTHYSVAVLMTVLCVLTLPMLLWFSLPIGGWVLATLWTTIVVSAVAPCVMYTVSGVVLRRGTFSFLHFPAMVVAGTGLCVNNARAVCEALLGRKSEFVRTPKSGSTNEVSLRSRYTIRPGMAAGLIEVLLGLYCLLTFALYLQSAKYWFGIFMGAYGIGLLTFGLLTLKEQMALHFFPAPRH